MAFSRRPTQGTENLTFAHGNPLNYPSTGAYPVTSAVPCSGEATAAALPEKGPLPPEAVNLQQQSPPQATGVALTPAEMPPPYSALYKDN